jgi:hypothetical protein
MSQAHKRRGTRPPKAEPAWTQEEEALLGRMPDKEVARRTGWTVIAVKSYRWSRRIPPAKAAARRGQSRRGKRTEDYRRISPAGNHPQDQAAP